MSYVGVSVRVAGATRGAVCAMDLAVRAWTGRDVQLLRDWPIAACQRWDANRVRARATSGLAGGRFAEAVDPVGHEQGAAGRARRRRLRARPSGLSPPFSVVCGAMGRVSPKPWTSMVQPAPSSGTSADCTARARRRERSRLYAGFQGCGPPSPCSGTPGGNSCRPPRSPSCVRSSATGHDAAHRQIFDSHARNEWAARLLSGTTLSPDRSP